MNYTFHSKLDSTKVRVTVAAVEKDGKFLFGVSRCSERDQFVKKTGRERALERALTHPFQTVKLPKKVSGKLFVMWAMAIAETVKQEARSLTI